MAVDEPVPVDAGALDVKIMTRSTLLFEVLLSPAGTLKLPAPLPPLGKQALIVAKLEPVAVDKVAHHVSVTMETKAKSVHDFFVWSSRMFTWAELQSLRRWSMYGVKYSFAGTLIPKHLQGLVHEATSLMLRHSAYPHAANTRRASNSSHAVIVIKPHNELRSLHLYLSKHHCTKFPCFQHPSPRVPTVPSHVSFYPKTSHSPLTNKSNPRLHCPAIVSVRSEASWKSPLP